MANLTVLYAYLFALSDQNRCHHLNFRCKIALYLKSKVLTCICAQVEINNTGNFSSLQHDVHVSLLSERFWHSDVGTHRPIHRNAGFNDAFIVPTVAGGVPRDGREPG